MPISFPSFFLTLRCSDEDPRVRADAGAADADWTLLAAVPQETQRRHQVQDGGEMSSETCELDVHDSLLPRLDWTFMTLYFSLLPRLSRSPLLSADLCFSPGGRGRHVLVAVIAFFGHVN